MGSIKNVVSEPIEGHEDYNMMVTVLAATCMSDLYFMKMPNFIDSEQSLSVCWNSLN